MVSRQGRFIRGFHVTPPVRQTCARTPHATTAASTSPATANRMLDADAIHQRPAATPEQGGHHLRVMAYMLITASA